MSVRYVCVFIDEFSSRAYGFPNVTMYDYASWDLVEYYDDWYYDVSLGASGYYGSQYGKGLIDDSQTLNYGNGFWTAATEIGASQFVTSGQVSNGLTGYSPYTGGYAYDNYTDYTQYLELNSVLPYTGAGPAHGDWVLKAFFDQLDDPNSVEVICIDNSFGTSTLWDQTYGGSSYGVIDVYRSAYNSLDTSNENLTVGLNYSAGTADPDAVTAVNSMISGGAFVVQAAPNPNEAGDLGSWADNISNVINVGAWNVASNGDSLMTKAGEEAAIDLYADGYVTNASWGSGYDYGWTFGTSFAAPTVFAEMVNLLDENLTPLIESGEASSGDEYGVPTYEEVTTVTGGIVEAISDPVEIIKSSGSTEQYVTLNVLSDDLYDGNIQPTVVTGFSSGESYQMRSAQLASENIDPTVVDDWFYIDEDTGTLSISVSGGVLNNSGVSPKSFFA